MAQLTVTVPRSQWARGNGETSTLLNDAGCRCIVGWLMHAAGIPDREILALNYESVAQLDRIPPALDGLVEEIDGDTRAPDANDVFMGEATERVRVVPGIVETDLMTMNDEACEGAELEGPLTALCAEQLDIELVFVD